MKILKLPTNELLEIVGDTLNRNKIPEALGNLIFREVEQRVLWRSVVVEETELEYRGSLLVLLGEILGILRNNHIGQEQEAYLLEEMNKFFENSVEENEFI